MITPSVALKGGLRLGNAVRGDRRTHYTDMQAWPPAAPPVETALGSHANSGGAKSWDRRSRGSLRIYCRICFADALRDGLSACTGLASRLSSLGTSKFNPSGLNLCRRSSRTFLQNIRLTSKNNSFSAIGL